MKIVKTWTLASLRKCYQTGDYFPAMHDMLTVYRKYVGNAGEGGALPPIRGALLPREVNQ